MEKLRSAIFIDGGYLDQVLLGFGRAKIDYSKLCDVLTNAIPLLRTYYYHCLPHQPTNPTPEQSREFSNAEKFQKRLNRLPNFTVRRGKLAYRGNDDEGRPIYEQKRVDVALATDLVMHATKRLISHAILITGDSDFIPAVEIAKAEGVQITLYYAQNKSTHDELLDVVDIRKLITQDIIDSIKR
ncbi:NYN domain-containing protein [Paenibacillaceae bacterium WGS1546]|uniref:NYN domain-containing protein n=1 Tax=Cohnella sp. WGS1546 TaxID=3366810 RepID=UPI00372D1241